jgi:N-methylhydantoinase B/oxoprolinase/acetone carboxylase alpha subunit
MVANGRTRILKTKEMGVPIPPGALFLVESAGGGGYGNPKARDPRARAVDLVNGFVSHGNGHRGSVAARKKRGRATARAANGRSR